MCWVTNVHTMLDNVARVERMKEAKIEAEQIIAAYRAEMEAVYQKSLAAVRYISFASAFH